MTLKEFIKLTGDEILEFNGFGTVGRSGADEKFRIVGITYYKREPVKMTVSEFLKLSEDEIKKLVKLEKDESKRIEGGYIKIEHLDGKPFDIPECTDRGVRYTKQRGVDYRCLRVVK